MLLLPRLLALLAAATTTAGHAAAGGAACTTPIDCQLNGICRGGQCECDAAWGGSNCSSLQLLSPPGFTSRRRDCHFTDIPSPSLLKHLLKGEGDAAE